MQTWPEIAHSFEERFLGLFNLLLYIRWCRKAFFLLLLPEYLTSHTYFRIQVSFKEMKRFGDQGRIEAMGNDTKEKCLKASPEIKVMWFANRYWKDILQIRTKHHSEMHARGKLSGCALWTSLRLLIQAHCYWAAQLFCEWVAREVSLSNELNC